MQIRKFQAKDMRTALSEIKAALGPDAVILATKNITTGGLFSKGFKGVEVTAAIDDPDEHLTRNPPPASNHQNFVPSKMAQPFEQQEIYDQIAQNYEEGSGDYRHNGQDYSDSPPPMGYDNGQIREDIAAAIQPIQDEIRQICHEFRQTLFKKELAKPFPSEFETFFAQIGDFATTFNEARSSLQYLMGLVQANQHSDRPPELSHFLHRFSQSGMDGLLIENILLRLEDGMGEHETLQTLTSKVNGIIRGMIKVETPLWASPKHRAVAFVGPTGVGKTTTIAKIAGRAKVFQHKNVGLITIDTYRVGAIEQLKAYAELMAIPLHVVESDSELKEQLEKLAQKDLILIDTAGQSPWDGRALDVLKNILMPNDVDVQLCLSATTNTKDLMEIIPQYAPFKFSSITFTKLDESRNFGALLSVMTRSKQPVSHLCTGQKVPEDIEPAKVDRLAQLMAG
jgi:flagellar biosynthesis protein FlhF